MTFRALFAGVDRQRLVRQILEQEPPAPRKLRPGIPRDLETVVLKAIAKEPEARYRSAAALAGDLQRYLDGRPVTARPLGPLARTWRWCRRNPLVASLAAAAGVLLVMVAVVSTVAAWRLAREQAATQTNLDRAVQAEHEASHSAEVAHRRLFDALIARAQASRRSGRAGQRFDSIASLREAMTLGIALDDDERRKLRNQAIASLSLVDLQVDRTWSVPIRSIRHGLAFDPLLERFAHVDPQRENIVVYRVRDQQPIVLFAARHDRSFVPQLRFGPGGKYLATKLIAKNSAFVCVWNLEDAREVALVPAAGEWFYSDFDISPNGGTLAVAQGARSIVGYDLRNASEAFRHAVAGQPVAVRFHPRQPRLAVAFSDRASLVDLESGSTMWTTDAPAIHDIDFDPDGGLLAVGDNRGAIRLLETTNGKALRTLTGHRSDVIRVNFNHDGTLLASTSWDTTTRIWDPHSGEQLLLADMPCHSFSRDDRWLGIGAVGPIAGRWTLAPRREYQKLHTGFETDPVRSLDIAPGGRLIAAGLVDRVVVWSTSPGAARVVLPTFGGGVGVAFEDPGGGLITSDATGVFRRSIEWHDPSGKDWPWQTIRIGRPQRIADPNGYGLSEARSYVEGFDVRRSRETVEIIASRDEPRVVKLSGHIGVSWTASSVDGKWIATATLRGRDVVIWDALTAKEVKRIECGRAKVAFAPDGRTLVVGTNEEYAVYKVPSWDLLYRVPRTKSGGLIAQMAFSADGSLLAVCDEPWIVRLLDARSGQELAFLVCPTTDVISVLSFGSETGTLAAGTSGAVHCWDLARIRHQLAELRLDWEPAANWEHEESASQAAVRFDAEVVSPLTAVRSLAAGDHDAYREACQHLQQEFPPGSLRRGPLVEIALACTTGEGGLTEAESVLSVLEQTLQKFPFHHDLVVPLLAVRHRTGDFAEVVKLAQRERLIYSQAVAQPRYANWVKGLRVLALAHLAMTHHKLGQIEQARQCLAEAEHRFDDIVAIHSAGDAQQTDLPPERFVAARMLLAEAREMIDPAE